nr:hypothetical protein TetV2_00017 [Oceanusvirus sp.]
MASLPPASFKTFKKFKKAVKRPASAVSPPVQPPSAKRAKVKVADDELHRAIRESDGKVVGDLLKPGENDHEAMMLAASEDKPAIVKMMLDRGCEMDHRSFGLSRESTKVLIAHIRSDPKEMSRALSKVSQRATAADEDMSDGRRKGLREDAVRLIRAGAKLPTVSVPFESGKSIDMSRARTVDSTIECLMEIIRDLLKDRVESRAL